MSLTDRVPFRTDFPTTAQRRALATDHLLTSLEALVRRHRGLGSDPRHGDLHAELIAAEVAQVLAVTRDTLRRHPRITPAA